MPKPIPHPVQLGDRCKDTVSGFEGIATSRTEWLHGCVRIALSPAVGKDGKLPDGQVFDEPQLDILERGAVRGHVPPETPPAQRNYGDRNDKLALRR